MRDNVKLHILSRVLNKVVSDLEKAQETNNHVCLFAAADNICEYVDRVEDCIEGQSDTEWADLLDEFVLDSAFSPKVSAVLSKFMSI